VRVTRSWDSTPLEVEFLEILYIRGGKFLDPVVLERQGEARIDDPAESRSGGPGPLSEPLGHSRFVVDVLPVRICSQVANSLVPSVQVAKNSVAAWLLGLSDLAV